MQKYSSAAFVPVSVPFEPFFLTITQAPRELLMESSRRACFIYTAWRFFGGPSVHVVSTLVMFTALSANNGR